MHLKSLKVFCDVVGRRSFSRAAVENGISQSGASQVVHQLERHLGTKLIDRSKRPFTLTPEGEIYYGGCRKIVERYFALEDRVRTLHDEVAGRVRVASIYSVGLHHMDRYLHQFLSQYPKANVRLEYLHPHKVYDAIESDHADLGLVSYPKPSRTIKAIGWRQEPMVLVCAPGHRFAKRQHVSLEEVAGEALVGFDADLTIRREIDRVLLEHRSEINVVMEFDNIETIKRAVEIDAGVSLLPAPTVVREMETGALSAVPLSTNELVRPLGIIHRRGKDLGVTVRKFIELLRGESHLSGAHVPATAQHGEADSEFTAAGRGAPGHGASGHNGRNHLAGNGAAALAVQPAAAH
ncbi:MAG TPA: LysR family transcriptional regulator [Pirellulales bacterium]|nr:LysR family transcriptional regulator [Pirellulales bacterium]